MLPPISVDLMISNMKMLLDAKQYSSAELLGNFIISLPSLCKSNNNISSVTAHYTSLIMFADAVSAQQQYARATKYYKASLELINKAMTMSSGHTSLFNSQSNKQQSNQNNANTVLLKQQEYDIRYKMAICQINLKKINLAVSYVRIFNIVTFTGDTQLSHRLLESIPASNRNLAVHLTLARLYRDSGNVMRDKTKDAISCFKEALRLCPLCIEAYNALKELGEEPEVLLHQLLSKQSTVNANIDSTWIPALAQSQIELKRNQPQKSLYLLKRLESRFHGNLYLLEKLAISYLNNDEPSIINTMNTFHKLRTIDSFYVGSMDIYCSLLKRRQLQLELNKVCSDLVNNNPNCVESWTSVALYHSLKENNEKALENVDRALSIRESHAYAHALKGDIFMSLEEPKEALPSLERAFALSKTIFNARELVRCHLFLNQLSEALNVARTIHRMSPDYSKSKALVGMVLANQPEERDKARTILNEALTISPYCIDSVLTMSKLNLVEGKTQDAIDLLQKQLDYQETDLMHTEMATIYMSKEMYDDAMKHLNAALEINPQYEAARNGLHRLDLILKGFDPDQMEDGVDEEDMELRDEDEEEIEDLEE
ncbi:anaphase promoting complex subunit 7 [Heterostelium album PN500]|uniref:Anaphase promoting complex subunit 7 n=1 Tax=Heterostelium pallidum (strain ATCC 26659 / Pp 5 / PN500) TaxID=670386 RepID=D3BIH5_HETP5|nr:anaphase promoting complex subunit 7 [Heterostelium album PN500]EFA78599.1 anaphase promoting complex subunit 7 [Heterostelium album PN500]|eukprot:XP_020430723.1 anaphase promoting complex subunit 7 [Heterostelium album PN500]